MWLWLALVACGGGTLDLKNGTELTGPGTTVPGTPGTTDPAPPEAHVTLAVAAAFDPMLGGPLDIAASADVDGALTIEVLGAEGEVLESSEADGGSLAFAWYGRDLEGGTLPVGAYTVRASLVPGEGDPVEAIAEVHLVRLGVQAVYATGDDDTASRVPLLWHGSDALQDPSNPIVAIEAIEDELGAPIPLPPVTDDLERVPTGAGEPAAFIWDSRPILTVELGESAVFGGSGVDLVDVGVALDGWSVVSGVPLRPGEPLVLQKDDILLDGVGVVDADLELAFVVGDAELGSASLPLRFYALLGPPTFEEEGLLYNPWVGAVEPALRGIQGTPAEHDAVLDALVRWVFEDLGLRYDTQWGASAYTVYEGSQWERARFSFDAFLERQMGSVVNCTDCAGILGSYANMVGAWLGYVIISPGFSLNNILAIGGDEFSSCPFPPNGCGFSYHAVATSDGGATIWDATLAIDGDGDPGSLPSTRELVQTMDGEAYLDAIVRDGNPYYHDESQGSIQ